MKKDFKNKIILGFAVIIASMSLLTIGAYVVSKAVIEQARVRAGYYTNVQKIETKLIVRLCEAETALDGYLAHRNPEQFNIFIENEKAARSYLTALQKLVRQDRMLKKLMASSADFLNDLDTAASGNGAVTKLELKERLGNSLRKNSKLLNGLWYNHEQALKTYELQVRKVFQTTLILVFIVATVAVLAGVIIARRITFYLEILIKGIREVSAGRYHSVQAVPSGDEVEELGHAFNKMVETLRNKEQDLHEKNEELTAQGEELSAQNEEIMAQRDELMQALTSLKRHEELLNRHYNFSQHLTQTIELDALMNVALHNMLNEAQAQVGAVLLYQPESGLLEAECVIGINKSDLVGLPIGDGLIGHAVLEKKAYTVSFDKTQLTSRGLLGDIRMFHEMYIPLLFNKQLLGVIVIGRAGAAAFSMEEQKQFTSLADQIAVALHNALSYRDICQTLKKVQEVDNLKSELINTVSHEFRTPLASVLGFTELLLKKPPEEAKAKKYIATIYHEALRLTELIDNFLDLQRIEQSRLDFSRQKVNLGELIQRSVALFQGQSHLHEVSAAIEPNLPDFFTDPERVTQILGNLLSNAIKYSPQGGPIELKAWRRSAAEIEISIKDQGLGIPKEAFSKIFSPFFRVDNSDRREIGGTGLGLAICQKMIRILGGEIWFESEHGKGSVFHFTLPIANDPESQTELSAAENEVAAQSC